MITFLVLAGLYLATKKDGSTEIGGTDYFYMFDGLLKKYAAAYGVDFKLMKAIMMNESGINPEGGIAKSVLEGLLNPSNIEGSKSSDGKSWGLMQMTLQTARDYDSTATSEKLNNPEYSIKLSAQYIAWVTLRFKSSEPRYTEWVVKSYNQGVGNSLKEKAGTSTGFAQSYWERFQRNYARL